MCESITRRDVEHEVEKMWNLAERPLVEFIEMEIRAQFMDDPYRKWALQKLQELITREENHPRT